MEAVVLVPQAYTTQNKASRNSSNANLARSFHLATHLEDLVPHHIVDLVHMPCSQGQIGMLVVN